MKASRKVKSFDNLSPYKYHAHTIVYAQTSICPHIDYHRHTVYLFSNSTERQPKKNK